MIIHRSTEIKLSFPHINPTFQADDGLECQGAPQMLVLQGVQEAFAREGERTKNIALMQHE